MKKLSAILVLIAFGVFTLIGLVFFLKGKLFLFSSESLVWLHITSLICFGCVTLCIGGFVISKIILYIAEGIDELFNC